MNLNQPTLIQFEEERRSGNFIPPAGSNSFYTIGNGKINILTIRDDPSDYRFDLFTVSGEINIGNDRFDITGDIADTEYPYGNFTIIKNTAVNVSNVFGIYKGTLESHGIFRILDHSHLVIRNGGTAVFYRDSDLVVNDNTIIEIDDGCSITIYGKIYINLNMVDKFINIPGVTIDSSAVMYVDGLESLGERLFSLTDYYAELSNQVINKNTQGEKNFIRGIGRIGYTWVAGDPLKQYQILALSALYGDVILGDFKLSVLGTPIDDLDHIQIINELNIVEGTTLHITEEYNGYRYVHPELYIGVLIGNCKTPGICDVHGKIIVDGPNASINIDRGSSLIINEGAEVIVRNGGTILSTYNEDIEVLFINGILTIDTIDQIDSFSHNNIVFGSNGKIIILNPDPGERTLLWSTPNGLADTKLYQLFEDRLNKVEYHISNNTGIKLDEYYEFYAKDFKNWYGGMRIEKAIHDGFIIWHDGGFIELDNSIIPWVDSECSLLHASRIFKTIGSYDYERVQEAAERLKYAGCGNITFVFIHGDSEHEVIFNLEGIEMINSINDPISDTYVLSTTNDGELFIKNNLPLAIPENIIVKDATVFNVNNNEAEFKLK